MVVVPGLAAPDGCRLGAAALIPAPPQTLWAAALRAQLDLVVGDPAIRGRIEVLNVDRLAYRVVRQSRGTPVIADERILRDRWAKAAAEAGLPRAASAREADDLLRDAETFLSLAESALGVEVQSPLPLRPAG